MAEELKIGASVCYRAEVGDIPAGARATVVDYYAHDGEIVEDSKQRMIDALVSELENIANEMRPLAARKSTRYAGLYWAIESAERAIRAARGEIQ